MKSKNGQLPQCLRLWHGTRKTEPTEVYSKDGLNVAYSADGMWGRVIYFAVNANYSCPAYSYKVPNANDIYEVFCADVAVGQSAELGNSSNRELKAPPQKPGTDQSYDSVSATT